MEKAKKIKFIVGLFYISAVGLFFIFFFQNLLFKRLPAYEFIKNNRDYFFELRRSNLILLSALFILFTIIWVFRSRLWFSHSSFWRVYFWKMVRFNIFSFWYGYWIHFSLHFC